jgi:flagellar biosynthetic protein FliP
MMTSRWLRVIVLILLVVTLSPEIVLAQDSGGGFSLPSIQVGVEGAEGRGDVSLAMQLLFLLTILSLAPSILLMLTSFTRIIIVLSFIGRALSLQGMPPRQVLVSLAIFITFFVMAPTAMKINNQAVQPYMNGDMGQIEALQAASEPLRVFMFKNTYKSDLRFFLEASRMDRPNTRADVPFWVLVPAFMLSEVKKAFIMGVLIFIPFVVIDMVVASVLMSMGMMMLPPVMISLPFKILLFVLVDGWTVITESLVETYGIV